MKCFQYYHKFFQYYHADNKLPKEAQELLKDQELIGGNDDPKFLGKSEVKKMVRSVEINKYDFMNDGIWIKYAKSKDFLIILLMLFILLIYFYLEPLLI